MPVSRTAITAASFSVAIVHHIFKNHRAGGQIGSPMRFRLGYGMVTGWQEAVTVSYIATPDHPLIQIDHQVGGIELAAATGCQFPVSPAQQCPNAGEEFAQAEGFGDVIVGNCSLTSHLSIRLPARQLQKM